MEHDPSSEPSRLERAGELFRRAVHGLFEPHHHEPHMSESDHFDPDHFITEAPGGDDERPDPQT